MSDLSHLTSDSPETQPHSSNLSPEVCLILAELYRAWMQYQYERGYTLPFLEWFEYTAGNEWLAAPYPTDAQHTPPPDSAGEGGGE